MLQLFDQAGRKLRAATKEINELPKEVIAKTTNQTVVAIGKNDNAPSFQPISV